MWLHAPLSLRATELRRIQLRPFSERVAILLIGGISAGSWIVVIGWIKTVAGLRKTKLRGLPEVVRMTRMRANASVASKFVFATNA